MTQLDTGDTRAGMARDLLKAIMAPSPCSPNREVCWALTHPERDHLAQVAASLKAAGEADDEDASLDLWEHHGYRSCMLAAHLAESHPELMPENDIVKNDIVKNAAEEKPVTEKPVTEKPVTENDDLFDQHRDVLIMAASRHGWRTMPAGGPGAIAAGLVTESDPTWQYSDDLRASNGFNLTRLGQSIMVEQGYVCECSGCALMPHGPAVTANTYCPSCQAGIRQYGLTATPDGGSCRFHAVRTEQRG